MTQSPPTDPPQGPLPGYPDAAFIERAFADAMALVEDSAAYLEREGAAARDALSEPCRTAFTGETLRMTTRLMQAVAWLMVQRAVVQGELTPEDGLAPKRRLGGQEICLGPAMVGADDLPSRLQELMAASRQIYERVVRLEDSLLEGRKSVGGQARNPVHGLLKRLGPQS